MSRTIEKLTARERQILDLVAAGLRNREIASHLFISEATVENHLHHVYDKLGVHNRTQAARWVFVQGCSDQAGNEGNPS